MFQGFGRMFITERAASQVLRWKPGDRDRTIREVADKHLDDLQIRPVALAGENGFAVRVSFADADRVKAQAGLTKLVTQAQEFNELMNGDNVLFWKDLYHQPVPFTERMEVLDPANLPATPSEPRRSAFLALGAAGGLLLGVLAMSFRRHPKAGLRVVVFGLAGFGVAAGLSLLVSERYTAGAEMRIGAPNDPEHLSGALAVTPLSEWAERLRKEVVIPGHFEVQQWDRERTAKLLRVTREGNIGIRTKGSETAMPFLEVTFRHPDRSTATWGASGVTAALVTQYHSDLMADTPASGVLREARQSNSGERFYIDRWRAPTSTHYRWEIRAAGALLGVLLSIVWKRRMAPRTDGDVVWAAA
jgi:hypothetical protein